MPTLLVVEDQELICRVIRVALETRGYALLTALNAEEALAAAQQHDGSIELLITDVVLAGSSGVALAAQLRDAGRINRVLFMSGHDRDELPLEESAQFLPKPFTMQQLVAAVDGIFEEHPSK